MPQKLNGIPWCLLLSVSRLRCYNKKSGKKWHRRKSSLCLRANIYARIIIFGGVKAKKKSMRKH